MGSPLDELREALEAHAHWPRPASSAAVIDAARRLVQAIDMRAQVIEQMRQTISPTEQAISELMGP